LIVFTQRNNFFLIGLIGTALYHPPEMLEQRKFIAGPGMVWALGVIGYTLLTGSPPFKEGSLKKRKAKFPKEISKGMIFFILFGL